MSPFPMRFLAVLLAFAPALAAAEGEHEHHWSYGGRYGPQNWSDVKPEFAVCRRGKHQSPINIRGAVPSDLPAIEFSYNVSPLRIIDNGHTAQVNVDPGSFITVGGKRYDLQQFHFHHPAEEHINGHVFPLEAHLVHKDAEGKLAVIAVLFKHGGADKFLQGLWKHYPREPGKEIAPEGATVDPGQILPANHAYYTYSGSLTTPPCSEDVTWFVFKEQVEVSRAGVSAFAAKYPHNARPVQPLNGRTIQVSH